MLEEVVVATEPDPALQDFLLTESEEASMEVEKSVPLLGRRFTEPTLHWSLRFHSRAESYN